MEIVNNTKDDATVSVSGGGGGMIKGHVESLRLPAGRTIHLEPKPPGPWMVSFDVGSHQTRKTVHSANEQVILTREGNNGFRAS